LSLNLSMIANILHILTALSLFFSTTGLTVSFHYCEDAFSGLAIFKEASSCHDENSTCHTAKSCCQSSSDKKDCCDTETEFFKQDIEKIITQIDLADIDLPLTFLDTPQTFTNWTLLKKVNSKFQYYRPPPLIQDIPVLFETFRC